MGHPGMTRGLLAVAILATAMACPTTTHAFGWPGLAFGDYHSAPQSIATDGAGTWIVAAGLTGARSLDNGLTWTPTTGLRSVATDRRGTWVAIADGVPLSAIAS